VKLRAWQKVAKDLSLQVALGNWPVGSLIPGELELAGHYGVSRDTMRKALSALTEAGLFERHPHTGTRVKAKNQTGQFVHAVSDIRQIDEYGSSYPRRTLSVGHVVLTEEEADHLGLESHTYYLRMENIRIASDEVEKPVVVTYVYIPTEARSVLEESQNNPGELMVSLVEQCLGRECTEVRQIFSATAMPEDVAAHFALPAGSATQRIVRRYLDREGLPIVVSESFYPADRFSFTVTSRKKTAVGL
jgi:DNA-binding GntR family transcriptional regulator